MKRYLEFLDEDIGDSTVAGALSGVQYAEIAISRKGLPASVINSARYLEITPPPVSIMLRQWKENALKIK